MNSPNTLRISRIAAVTGLALGCASFVLPGNAGADSIRRTSAVCVPGAQGPNAAIVVAITGDVWAQSANCGAAARRPLACGAVVYGGESVVTAGGANAALEMQGARVQVGPETEVIVDVAASGAPEIALQSGSVRVVDADPGNNPERRLSTPHLVAVGHGDTEASVLAGGTSSLCEYALPLAIERSSVRTLEPGSCVGGGATSLAAGGPGVSLFDAGSCAVADAGRFDPIDVASGPVGFTFPPPDAPPPPPPSCLTGACGGNTPTPPPTPPVAPPVIVESPGVNEPPPL